MTQRLTLPQQRAKETRRRILDAAGGVFAHGGYGQSTMDDIAEEAGISKGALYHHFPSKEELYRALLDDHLHGELSEFAALGGAESMRDLTERFVGAQVEHLTGDRESGLASMDFWAQAAREDWVRRPVAEFHRRMRDVIARLLRAGQAEGLVRRELDADAAAFLIQALFEGTSVLLAIEPDACDPSRLAKPWSDLVYSFITPDSVPAEAKGALQRVLAALVSPAERETQEMQK